MNNLSIKKIYYEKLTRYTKQAPRERFRQYYDDLAKIAMRPEVNPLSYLQGAQYSYVELLDTVLPAIQAKGYLEDLELIVMSFWSPEFDPDHACGAYPCHRYAFDGKILDISDCGFLSPFVALSAVQNYMQYDGVTRALFVGMDQTTVPYHAAINKISLPSCSSIGALLLVAQLPCTPGLHLVLSKRVKGKVLLDFLCAMIKKYALTMHDALLTCNQNLSHKKISKFLPFKNISYSTRSGNSVEKLFSCKIFQQKIIQSKYRWHVLLVQEESRDEWGVLLMRVVL